MNTCRSTLDRDRLVRSPDVSSPLILGPLRHYVVFRADLPPGFATAQVIHAAGESASLGDDGLPRDGTYAHALHVPDEASLLAISARLSARKIRHVVVYEPDAPWNGQATAIGIAPTRDKKSIDKVVSSLPNAYKGIK